MYSYSIKLIIETLHVNFIVRTNLRYVNCMICAVNQCYLFSGAASSDIIAAKANVCLKEIALLTELAEVRRQKKVLMRALGEQVPDTPDSSQVLGTSTKRSHLGTPSSSSSSKITNESSSTNATNTRNINRSTSARRRSSHLIDSLMSIMMVDTKSKDGDAFESGSGRKSTVNFHTEKLV